MSERTDLELTPRLKQDLYQRLARKKGQILWSGIALTAAGAFAIVFPSLTTLTIGLMVGWILLIAGVAGGIGAFSYEGTGQFFGALLISLLKFALGIYLVLNPGVGIVALTLLVAALFMVEGAYQMAFAFDLKPQDGWAWVAVSAVVSILAGVLIAAGLPGTSLFVLGFLLGVNFLSAGISLIMLSRKLKDG